jgi:hypothetical protein
MALSQLAKAGLDVAAEHLFAIRTLIEAGQVLLIASRSILRTALVRRRRLSGFSNRTTLKNPPVVTAS